MNVSAEKSSAKTAEMVTQVTPVLITARQAAMLCGRGLRTWRTWNAAGRIPRPVRIGRAALWRTAELQAWIAAGCPPRAEWESLSKSNAGMA